MPSTMPLLHVRLEPRHREKLERLRVELGLPSEASTLRWLVEHADDRLSAPRKKSEKKSE